MRVCPKCDRNLPLDDYYIDRSRKNGHTWKCKDCHKAEYRSWSSRNNHARTMRRYGITPLQYLDLFNKQGGGCATCGTPPGPRRLSVDHCHTTGKVRGLLCGNCNRAMGLVRDDPDRLRALIKYLEKARAT